MIWFVYELRRNFVHLEGIARRRTYEASSEDEGATEGAVDSGDDDESDYEGRKYTRLIDKSILEERQLAVSRKNYDVHSMSVEERLTSYQKFYLHFGACSLVWFIYLPCLIFITSFVSELYRLRLVLSKILNKTNTSFLSI